MLEGGRVLAVFFLVFLLTETGVQIVGQLTGWCKPAAGAGQPTQHTTLQYQGQQDQKVRYDVVTKKDGQIVDFRLSLIVKSCKSQ